MKHVPEKFEVKPHIQDAYNAQYAEDISEWRELGGKYKAQNIIEVCASLRARRRVLDVGAGDGGVLVYLDRQGFADELYAVEISQSGVERIQQRQLKSLRDARVFDGYTIPYEDGFFDLVILSHVLEHVEFPRLLLREIARVSHFQVIEIPCDFTFDVDERVENFLSYGHINIYTPSLARFLLKSEGFEILADKLSLTAPEVVKYNAFVNRKWKRTWKSNLRLQLRMWRQRLAFHLGGHVRRQLEANAYTVLCKKGEEELEIFNR